MTLLLLLAALLSPVMPPGGAGVTEEKHEGKLTRHGDRVVLRVTRAVRNETGRTATLALDVGVPRDGAIVGLKVLGAGVAELQQLTLGRAVLVFPDVPPNARRRATYTIEARLEPRRDGLARLWMPAGCESCLPLSLREGRNLLIPTGESPWRPYDLPAEPPTEGDLRFGAVPAGRRWAWRAEVTAPATLGEPPRDGRVVVLVDRSHSQGTAGLAKQRLIVEALAERMPADTRFAVVAYGRSARTLADGFVSAKEALAGWETLVPENGSNLDAGLRLATRLLRWPGADDRVIVITDALLRSGLGPEALMAEVEPGDAVLHVLVADALARYGPIRLRQDGHPLAPLADRHGGMLQVVTHSENHPDAPQIMVEPLGWPTEVDGLALRFDGAAKAVAERVALGAGASEVLRGVAPREPQLAELRGRVWAEAWRREAARDAETDRRAALWSASDASLEEELTDSEVEALGKKHRVVTRLTALRGDQRRVAVVKPADFGLTWGRGGGGSGSGVAPPAKFVELDGAVLTAALGEAIRGCGAAPGGDGRVSVETTRDELVAVTVQGLPVAVAACVEAAVWQVRLPATFKTPRGRGAVPVSAPEPAPLQAANLFCRAVATHLPEADPCSGADALAALIERRQDWLVNQVGFNDPSADLPDCGKPFQSALWRLTRCDGDGAERALETLDRAMRQNAARASGQSLTATDADLAAIGAFCRQHLDTVRRHRADCASLRPALRALAERHQRATWCMQSCDRDRAQLDAWLKALGSCTESVKLQVEACSE